MMMTHRILLTTLLLLAFITVVAHPIVNKDSLNKREWVCTWGNALLAIQPNDMPPKPGLTNHVLRQIVCVSIGGEKLKLKVSNKFGNSPLTIKSIRLAVAKDSCDTDTTTATALTFHGQQDVTLPTGKELYSDPAFFNLQPRARIAITITFGETPSILTGHGGSRTTSYILKNQPSLPDTVFRNATKVDHWYIIAGLEVQVKDSASSLIVFGDSIADGRGSGINKQNRWPDILSENLLKSPSTNHIAVVNMGIGGNCILKGGLGPTGLQRFENDVLQQNNAKWLILAEGINDIGIVGDSVVADKVADALLTAYKKFIFLAHAKGIKVYGATLLPFKKSFYYTTYKEAARNKVNDWIRKSNAFDAVIDFDSLMRDPKEKDILLYEAQSGANDYLHPNELGYRMMGNGIDLSLFK